jgi:hypothetical protein
MDVRNVGDMASNPALYWPEFAGWFTADLTTCDLDAFDDLDAVVVVGGGLLRPCGNGWYADRWRHTLGLLAGRKRPRLLVLWGVGHIDNRGQPVQLSDFVACADLVGIRDRLPGVPFVPCASAMHPHFDALRDPVRDVAVFHTADYPLGDGQLPTMANDCQDVAAAMAHCASAEVLVTNSYHGWYWATLAGRRVVPVNPRTNKFDVLAWPTDVVRVADPGTFDGLAVDRRGVAHPGALDEARAANRQFAERVAAAVGDR